MNKQSVVLATHNNGKVVELSAALNQLGYHLVSQADYGVGSVAETGHTFVENALIKARHAAEATGLPAIADDSGLVVDALNGAPGLFSARYAGQQADCQQNRDKLLSELAHVPEDRRQAYFHCVLIYLRHPHDAAPVICEGRWAGVIAQQPSGSGGFGYDPVFYLPQLQRSAAQLSVEEKNRLSHRGQALTQLVAKLRVR